MTKRGRTGLGNGFGAGTRDAWLSLAAALAAAASAAAWTARHAHVFEDAANTLRYVRNIGDGYGWSYNAGGPRVDGVSDPLSTLLLAVLARCGADPFRALLYVDGAAHAATAGILALAAGRSGRAAWVGLAAALIFSVGPGLLYMGMGFPTPVFAAVAALAWCIALTDMTSPDPGNGTAFGAAVGLLCLARFEGAILAAGFIAGALALDRRKAANYVRPAIAAIFLSEALIVGVREAWFGTALPMILHKKHGFYWSSLAQSSRHVLGFCGPSMLALTACAWRDRKRLIGATLAPVVLFTVSWTTVSDAQNYFGRYQYPLLAVVLLSVVCAFIDSPLDRPAARRPAALAALGLAGLAAGALYWRYAFQVYALIADESWNSRATEYVGRQLAKIPARNLRLATSEGGIIPYYSGWASMDAWGINDARIVADGLVSPAILADWRPDLITLNVNLRGFNMPEPDVDTRWIQMCRVLVAYARDHGYRIGGLYLSENGGEVYSADVYFVREDSPEAAAIERVVSAVPDYSFGSLRFRNATRDPEGPDRLFRLTAVRWGRRPGS